MARRKAAKTVAKVEGEPEYGGFVANLAELLEQSRRTAARAVNSALTATYWEMGRRIVEFEQGGEARAEYGEALLERLAADLTARFGRGFSAPNLFRMRTFYLGWQIFSTSSREFEARVIVQTVSGLFAVESLDAEAKPARKGPKVQTVSAQSSEESPLVPDFADLIGAFRLSWSHYVRLLSVQKPHARAFYEAEAIRGGWSVRQLDRQVGTQFFERTSASKRQDAMLETGRRPKPEDAVTAQDEIRDPYILEFLDLKDEYSEAELEGAIIARLEEFLLEMGSGFTFVGRQKRIRVGDSWYRIDLLLYHRVLHCLVVIDLKTGPFTHADAGQMNLYLNYVREHLTLPDEAAPVGIILCSEKDDAVVKYATGGIQAQVFASKYLTDLPDTETLRREILATRHALEHRPQWDGPPRPSSPKRDRP